MENIYNNRAQIKTMLELIQRAKVKSMAADSDSHEIDCDITLSVNGEYWRAYSVSARIS